MLNNRSTDRHSPDGRLELSPERILVPPKRSRLLFGVLTAAIGPVLATAAAMTAPMRTFPATPYLLVVLLATTFGRLAAGAIAAFVSVGLLDYYILEPKHALDLGEPENLYELFVFLATAIVLAQVMALWERAAGRARQTIERQAFLIEAGQEIGSSLDLRNSMERLAHLVVPALADWCAIHLVDEHGTIEPHAVAHADPERAALALELQDRYPVDPKSPSGVPEVIRTGRPEHIPRISDELLVEAARDEEHLRIIRRLGLRSALVVPLRARGKVLGALTLVNAESAKPLGRSDLEFAEELADRMALTIDNLRLYETQRRIAGALQASLLPTELPRIPGIQVAARYWPAGEASLVGGDFFDVFRSGEGSWVVLVGDVCGKGPEAAALTGLVRWTAKAVAGTRSRPSTLLRSVNQELLENHVQDRFCTACAVRIDVAEGSVRLTIARAGHPAPLVLRAEGIVEDVNPKGPLLGILAGTDWDDASLELLEGDSLILFTDGVTERGSLPQRDLRPLLLRNPSLGAEDLVRRVEAAVAPASLKDDAAIVILHRRTGAGRSTLGSSAEAQAEAQQVATPAS